MQEEQQPVQVDNSRRRAILGGLAGVAATAAATVTNSALAQTVDFKPNGRYPDVSVQVLDPQLPEVPHLQLFRRADRYRHALDGRPCVVRRWPLPALQRHPQQPHHALG